MFNDIKFGIMLLVTYFMLPDVEKEDCGTGSSPLMVKKRSGTKTNELHAQKMTEYGVIKSPAVKVTLLASGKGLRKYRYLLFR